MLDSNNLCKNCKYWFTRETWDDEKQQRRNLPNVGLCEKILHGGIESNAIKKLEILDSENEAITFSNKENCSARLITKSDFGCNLFEMSLSYHATISAE